MSSQRRANLEQIQRWMQSVIMYPGEVAEGVATEGAQSHLAVPPDDLESVIRPSQALDSASRLQIYVDAYYERLLECLREEFAATAAATGVELFDALAFGYLQQHPSRSYTLGDLGAGLPVYLAEVGLHARVIPDGADTSWPQFINELARFERLMREVFDSPGVEQATVLDAVQLAGALGTVGEDLRLAPAPCLRLSTFSHPVHVAWAAFKDGQPYDAGPPAETHLALSRRNYRVDRWALEPAEFVLLEALAGGHPLGESLEVAAQLPGVSVEHLESRLPGWLQSWLERQFFIGVLPAETASG